MGKFNVLHLVMFNADFPGSFGESLLALCKELKKRGISMLIIFPELREWSNLFIKEGCIVEAVPMGYPISIGGLIKLLRLVKKNEVKLIHTHFGVEYSLASALIHIISPLHPKLVWHWRGGPKRPNFIKKVLGTLAYKFLDKQVEVHIPNSGLIKQQLISYGIVTPQKVQEIYNGINPTRFDPIKTKGMREELGIKAGELIVGNVRNFRKEVDHKFIIDVARIVVSRNKNVRFLLVGDGPNRKSIEDYVDKSGIRDKVIFAGVLDNTERVYASCNLTIVSYEPWCGESICNAVYESLSMEKPVVIPGIGSTPYVFTESEGVFMVPLSAEAMATKIQEVLGKDSTLLSGYGKSGREAVLSKFTVGKWAEKVADIYCKAIKD